MSAEAKKTNNQPELPAELMARAKQVLSDNYRNGHTIPAEGLYPHQWLWDSCFVAIGLAHYDIERAKMEILNLLKGQWSNGMVPHMIFDPGLRYRQDRELWRSYTSPYSPDSIPTSGITQPPLIAEAVVQIGKKLSKEDRRAWYAKTYPHLVKYHKWLYRDRDPKNEGLVLLVHPWESGLDSSPPWMFDLENHHMALWIRLVKWLKLDNLVNKLRRDTHFVPPGQRLSTTDALLVFHVLRKLRHKGYSHQRIMKSKLPKVEDAGFNAIFIRANSHLQQIAKSLGAQLPQGLQADIKHTEEAYNDLWDEAASQYFSFNINTGEKIFIPSIATFLALYSGKISKEHAAKLVEHLENPQTYNAKFPVPSVPQNSDWFAQHRYWQGPTWINTNWLIADGLERYGFKDEAAKIRESSLKLVDKAGFYEYFSPIDGSPAGAHNFSWTAALTIDFLNRK
jgi:hypothetical protein